MGGTSKFYSQKLISIGIIKYRKSENTAIKTLLFTIIKALYFYNTHNQYISQVLLVIMQIFLKFQLDKKVKINTIIINKSIFMYLQQATKIYNKLCKCIKLLKRKQVFYNEQFLFMVKHLFFLLFKINRHLNLKI